MASGSRDVLVCKPRCKLHRAAFEEDFIEDVRSKGMLVSSFKQGFQGQSNEEQLFEVIGLAHISHIIPL